MIHTHHQKRGSFAKRNEHQTTKPGLMAQVLLYFGLIILLFSILYLILNRSIADSLIGSLLPAMIAGAALVVISQVIRIRNSSGHSLNKGKKK